MCAVRVDQDNLAPELRQVNGEIDREHAMAHTGSTAADRYDAADSSW
jgi:hypothetical protein